MSKSVVSTILSVAMLLGIRYSGVGGSHWPVIRPLSWSGEMDLLGPPTLIAIRSTSGAVVYRLYCSSRLASPEPEWLTQGDNYGADFECLLTDGRPGTPAQRATLLNYDPKDLSPYHSNLGSFTWEELLGKCRNNPVWGTERAFYLRGMRLKIDVLAVKVEQYKDQKQDETYPIIRRVTVNVSATPDKDARTSLAQPPSEPEPSGCT